MARRVAGQPIRVLLAESSRVQCQFLIDLLQMGGLSVVGTASDGLEAVAAARHLRPDVIVMEIAMPKLDGYEAARQIMESAPTPVVLVSSNATPEEMLAALGVGALTVIPRPIANDASGQTREQLSFVTTVRLMADVLVVTRRANRVVGQQQAPASTEISAKPPLAPPLPGLPPQILAIAASTGGPFAVQTLLSGLGSDFPLPILLAQHISHGFVRSLADWLQKASGFPVVIARPSDPLLPGHVYLAPEEHHLSVFVRDYAANRPARPEDHYCPNGDVLFETVAMVYGHRAIGVVLTGMGDDGARGLRALRAAGGRTLAQDEASSVVYGMPRAAVELGAAERSLPLTELARAICDLVPKQGLEHSPNARAI
jgi:two-component system, chemotaxis family, protein-glutamate methylesterase/glutaminase